MQRPRRRSAVDELKFVEEFAEDTPENREHLHEGLRILARIIARAIIREHSIQQRTLGERNDDSGPSASALSPVDQGQERLTLTAREVADLLGVSRNSIYEATRTGQVPSIKMGRRILIPRAALTKMLKETGYKTGPAQQL